MTMRRTWKLTLLVAVSVSMIAAGAGALALLSWRHQSAYPVPPRQFMQQSVRIKKDMTTTDVDKLGIYHSEVTRRPDRLTFRLDPRPEAKDRRLMLPPVPLHYFINVYLNENGLVKAVTTSDG